MKKGKLAEIKTKETSLSVDAFIESLPNEQQQKDCYQLVKLMRKHSKAEPRMWGSSIIGFGTKRYKSPKTGREVDWFMIGFSPRKANISLHLVIDLQAFADEIKSLGKHKTGVGCLYINKLEDVELKVLEKLIRAALLNK